MMVQNKPVVSAIITAYNCAKYVCEAIESVLYQTRQLDEIIVVDDGSMDQTSELIRSYIEKGVRYIYQENQGIGAARNRGILESKGEMIAFLDCDDIWLPRKTEEQVKFLQQNPDIGMVSSPYWWWDLSKDQWCLKYPRNVHPDRMKKEILIQNFVGNPSSTIILRKMIDLIGLFDPGLRWGVEWEYWIRLLQSGKIGFVSDPLIIYRWHVENVSHASQWERLAFLQNLSSNNVQKYSNSWERIILTARSISKFDFLRSWHLFSTEGSKLRQLWYLCRSLMFFPLDDFASKIKLLGRTLFEKGIHRLIRKYSKSDDSLFTSNQNPTNIEMSGEKKLPHPDLTTLFGHLLED